MDRLVHIAALLSILLAIPFQPARAGETGCSAAALDLTLDGVRVEGCLPFQPLGEWIKPDSTEMYQVAYTAGSGAGYTLAAIPFGTQLPSEVFPRIDAKTSEASLRETLRQTRITLGARTQPGPTAQLFGRMVESLVSTVYLPVSGTQAQLTRLTEWLVISGERLWILRAAQPVPLLGVAPAKGMNLASANLSAPSPSVAIYQQEAKEAQAAMRAAEESPASSDPYTLSSPAWWRDTCDKTHYSGSYSLGASYRNVISCGPLPGLGYPDVLVYFYPSAFPAYEWECVELVLRYLWLAYGVAPYPANGSGIVYNYGGSRMSKVTNGTAGTAPAAGDVLSYGSTSTLGHTSIVIDSNVDGSGNGKITVMEQNWTWKGQSTLNVSKWVVYGGSAGWVYGWLHAPENPYPSPTPTVTPCVPATQAPTPTAVPSDWPTATPPPNAVYMPLTYQLGC